MGSLAFRVGVHLASYAQCRQGFRAGYSEGGAWSYETLHYGFEYERNVGLAVGLAVSGSSFSQGAGWNGLSTQVIGSCADGIISSCVLPGSMSRNVDIMCQLTQDLRSK